MKDERQVDGAGQAGAQGQDPHPAVREATLDRRVGAQAPGENRDDRPDEDGAHLAASNVEPRMAIGMAASSVGSGSQTSNAGRGNDNGGVP